MSLGAAVSGLVTGFAKGAQIKSDLEDAETKRGLTRLQTQEIEERVNKAKREGEYEKERASLIDSLMRPQEAPEAPAASPDAMPEGAAPTGGAAPRPAGITPPGGQPKNLFDRYSNVNDFQTLTRLNTALTALDAKYGKIGAKELLEGASRYRKLQEEGVMDAWQKVAAGDVDGAIQTFNATGKVRLPEGTKFEARDEEIVPGSGIKTKNYYAISPDGRSVNMRDTMRGAIAPADLLKLDQETGFKIAEMAWRKESDNRLRDVQERQLDAQISHWKALEGFQSQQTKAALERLGLDRDKYRFDKVQDGLRTGYSQALDMAGYVKLSPEKADQLSDAQRAEQSNKLVRANVVYSIFEKNFDLDKAKPGITLSQASEAARFAAANRDKIQTDQNGNTFVEIGKQKIFVPAPAQRPVTPPGEAASPGPAAPTAGPAPAPARNALSDSLPPAAQSAGLRLDDARKRVEAANATAQTFGLRQRQQNPQGYAQALTDLERAKQELSAAEADYQRNLPRGLTGPLPMQRP